MDYNLYLIFSHFTHLSAVLPLGIYLWRSETKTNYNKLILIYLVVSFLYELITFFTEYFHIVDHNIVNFFQVIEYVLISLYFLKIYNNTFFKNIVYCCGVIFILVSIFSFSQFEGFYKINESVKSCAGLFVIGFCVLYFFETIQFFKPKILLKDVTFWLVAGFFFYFCSTFFFSIFAKQVLWGEHTRAYTIYFPILIFTIIYRILLTVGIWHMDPKK